MGVYHFLSYPDGKRKALTLSYDDGCNQDKPLIELLDRYGIRCTFNLFSDIFDRKDRWTPEEALQVYGNGPHEVAIHLAHHTAPGKVPLTFTAREIGEDRKRLEALFGRVIPGMAYPDTGIIRMTDGRTVGEVETCLSTMGILYARTTRDQTERDRFRLPQDFLAWDPTCRHANPDLMTYAQQFLDWDIGGRYISDQDPLLFYLWGHSREFDASGNWDLMEGFCRLMGNRDDIWYATNLEIYRYVTAYRRLEFSFDDTFVYNPSAIPVWFRKNETLFLVPAGETVPCFLLHP